MITISNEALSVTISEKGAELQSINYQNIEYLWQADADYWAKHAPVLFPIVGELRDGKYIFEDKEYKMPRHGFARDNLFEALKTSDTSVIFTLKSNESSLAVYPFMFVFSIEYRLEAARLSCIYFVENTDTKIIYFSVGGHPAFNVPLQSDLHYSDYTLTFNNDSILQKHLLHSGLTGDDTETIVLDNSKLKLQSSLFYNDAIVLKHIGSNEVKIASDKGAHGLKFTFDGFPYFGIWATKDAPFICLEPWCGIADNINHNYQLAGKEGINSLNVGNIWQREWSVEMY